MPVGGIPPPVTPPKVVNNNLTSVWFKKIMQFIGLSGIKNGSSSDISKAKKDINYVDSNCIIFGTGGGVISVPNLPITVTVVSMKGTAVPTVGLNQISFTAGTFYGIELNNGRLLVASAGSGNIIYETRMPNVSTGYTTYIDVPVGTVKHTEKRRNGGVTINGVLKPGNSFVPEPAYGALTSRFYDGTSYAIPQHATLVSGGTWGTGNEYFQNLENGHSKSLYFNGLSRTDPAATDITIPASMLIADLRNTSISMRITSYMNDNHVRNILTVTDGTYALFKLVSSVANCVVLNISYKTSASTTYTSTLNVTPTIATGRAIDIVVTFALSTNTIKLQVGDQTETITTAPDMYTANPSTDIFSLYFGHDRFSTTVRSFFGLLHYLYFGKVGYIARDFYDSVLVSTDKTLNGTTVLPMYHYVPKFNDVSELDANITPITNYRANDCLLNNSENRVIQLSNIDGTGEFWKSGSTFIKRTFGDFKNILTQPANNVIAFDNSGRIHSVVSCVDFNVFSNKFAMTLNNVNLNMFTFVTSITVNGSNPSTNEIVLFEKVEKDGTESTFKISLYGDTASGRGVHVCGIDNTGTLRGLKGTTTANSTSRSLLKDITYNLAITFNGSVWKVYLDNVLIKTFGEVAHIYENKLNYSFYSKDKYQIGPYVAGSFSTPANAEVSMSNVCLFDYVLTQSQLSSVYTKTFFDSVASSELKQVMCLRPANCIMTQITINSSISMEFRMKIDAMPIGSSASILGVVDTAPTAFSLILFGDDEVAFGYGASPFNTLKCKLSQKELNEWAVYKIRNGRLYRNDVIIINKNDFMFVGDCVNKLRIGSILSKYCASVSIEYIKMYDRDVLMHHMISTMTGMKDIYGSNYTDNNLNEVGMRLVPLRELETGLALSTNNGILDDAFGKQISSTNIITGSPMIGSGGTLTYVTTTVAAYSYLYRPLDGTLHHYAFDGTNTYIDGVVSADALPLTVTWTSTSGINGNLYLLKLYSVSKDGAWAMADNLKEKQAL